MSLTITMDLYRFIQGLSTDASGAIIENSLDSKISFVSKYYTPNLKVTVATSKLMDSLDVNLVSGQNNDSDPTSLVYMLQHSTLSVNAPDIYRMCQAVVADVFTIVYAAEADATIYMDLTDSDLDNISTECLYLEDYFSGLDYSDDTSYYSIANIFSNFVSALAIIKANLMSLQADAQEGEGTVSSFG